MSGTCPSCGADSTDALLCSTCTLRIEQDLGDVPTIVAELEVTLSRQARIGSSGKGGLASERTPIHVGAMQAGDDLQNTLTTWARDVLGDSMGGWASWDRPASVVAAHALLSEIPSIRKHPAAEEIVDEISDAVRRARRATDRAANRTIIFVGPCPEDDEEGVPCPGEVHAFIPTEDDRPPRMACTVVAEHRWSSEQWLRTGKRIVDRIAEQKRQARLRIALYGESA